jgi:hypothetical protein
MSGLGSAQLLLEFWNSVALGILILIWGKIGKSLNSSSEYAVPLDHSR